MHTTDTIIDGKKGVCLSVVATRALLQEAMALLADLRVSHRNGCLALGVSHKTLGRMKNRLLPASNPRHIPLTAMPAAQAEALQARVAALKTIASPTYSGRNAVAVLTSGMGVTGEARGSALVELVEHELARMGQMPVGLSASAV